MKYNDKDKREQSRAQAYSFEATIATLLIVVGIVFIVPSLATPVSEQNINEQKLESNVSDDITQMVEKHTHNGHLKSLILNYDSGQWETSHPTGEYRVGPSETVGRVTSENNDYRYFFQTAPGPVGKSIERIKEQHDVWITIELLPTENSSRTENRQIMLLGDNVGESVLTQESTTIVLHENDKLQSSPESHSLYGSASTVSSGNGLALSETNDVDDFVIEEDEKTSDSSIYNRVEVKITVYEASER